MWLFFLILLAAALTAPVVEAAPVKSLPPDTGLAGWIVPPAPAAPLDAAVFPIGIYHTANLDELNGSPGQSQWTYDREMRTLKAAGFNLVHTYVTPPAGYFALLSKYQLKLFYEVGPAVDKQDTTAIAAIVTQLRGNPQLLCWGLIDEAEPAQKPKMTAAYQQIKALDPAHLIFVDQHNPEWFGDFGGTYDVLGIDPYPLLGVKPDHPISQVGDWMDDAVPAADGKPVWLIVQAFAATDYWRPPTAEELRNIAFQGLVHGARGLLYYATTSGEGYPMRSGAHNWFIFDADFWPSVAPLNGVVQHYAPVLLTPTVPQDITVKNAPGLHVLKKQGADGQAYLFLVNETRQPYEAQVVVPRLTSVSIDFGPSNPVRLHRTTDGFGEWLEPLAVRVYRIAQSSEEK